MREECPICGVLSTGEPDMKAAGRLERVAELLFSAEPWPPATMVAARSLAEAVLREADKR